MSEKKVDVTKRYCLEIQDIKNKLQQLEDGRIYELSSARMDGYLANNIIQLRKMIDDLIDKIEFGDDSRKEELGKTLGKINI